jgi:hypothetical protein
LVIIGSYWCLPVLYTKAYIDTQKTADMTKQENYDYDEIAKEWENFENEIFNFVNSCKSFFGKSSSSK